MAWVSVALLGYFFFAVASAFDKYLLSGPIERPAGYAFFVALFSLFTIIFLPFGFQYAGAFPTFIFLLSGAAFLYGILALYFAVKGREISRVAPLAGTVASVVVLLIGLGSVGPNPWLLIALVLLVVGGFLISFDLPLKKNEHFSWHIMGAGLGLGLSAWLFKYGYHGTADLNFVSGLVWSRFGIFFGGLSLLLFPVLRRQIIAETHRFSKGSRKKAASTGAIFVVSKTCAGIAALLVAYATFLGPVTFVQALSGMQYVFLLLLILPLAYRYPKIYDEKLHFWDWVQKGCAIILIGIGLWMAAIKGGVLL